MKIKYSPLIFIVFIVILVFLGNSFLKNNETSGDNVYNYPKQVKSLNEVIAEKRTVEKFDNVKLFEYNKSDIRSGQLKNYMKTHTLLNLKKNNLQGLLNSQKENITFEIPLSENNSIKLELTKVPVFAEKFEVKMITENGIKSFDYTPGIYYRGIVKDNPRSVATISIFNNSVMGMISDESGNYNLGVLSDDNSGENYIYYNEKDLYVKNKFKCGVDDFGKMRIKNSSNNSHLNINNNSDNPYSRLPVKVYFVADYRMYLDFNSSTSNVTNYLSGLFNEVSSVYQNEFLPVQIASVYVYTIPDPYVNLHSSDEILFAFGDNTKDNFNGDLAHLVSTRNESFGGISWVNSLCETYNAYDHSGRFSFSGIDNSYSPFPTYSWSVTVITHEMGHSFGSMHTHACWWPIEHNTIGQIDSCYASSETCINYTVENFSGTIMSYCHLNGAIDLYLGFGSMPGDTIRLRYNQCSRFGPVINSSELPTAFQLDQNFPNPFNPSTTISFAVPEDAFISVKVYDISGREIAELLNNRFYSRGYQNVLFNSASYNLSSGVYLYKLTAKNTNSNVIFSQVKKMILVK